MNQRPADSSLDVIAWREANLDTVIRFTTGFHGDAPFLLATTVDTTLITFDGTADVRSGELGANCTSLAAQAPADLLPPVPIRCRLDVVSAAFTGALRNLGADAIVLPNQTLRGIRFEFEPNLTE